MFFWYLLILLVSLANVKVCKTGFFQDYIGKEQGNAVKGLFIMLVFMRHIMGDIKQCGFSFEVPLDRVAQLLDKDMNQLIVAVFLFYSGYGVMRSLMTKGEIYLTTYPKSRLLTTLVNFDIAVCFFLLLGWMMGRPMGLYQILMSFIGWESLGNSNWYIFVILLCYLTFYSVFVAVRDHHRLGAFLVTLFLFCAMLILHHVKQYPWWYNTIMVFPSGVIYALCSEQVEKVVHKWYWLSLAVFLVLFLALHYGHPRPLHGLTFNIQSIVFSLLIVVMTMKVRIGNKWLVWCGMSLFPFYIYQRLPMIATRSICGDAWICANPNLFIGLCLTVTVAIVLLYNKYLRIKLV